MIISFADKMTKTIFEAGGHRKIASDVAARAVERLDQLDAAVRVEDMRFPPGNRLEKLSGNRAGRWSVRVNKQYRITFGWDGENAVDVLLEDYH